MLVFTLSSCSWFKTRERIVYRTPEVIHPSLPAPVVLKFDPKVKVKVVDNKVVSYMSFNDMLSLIKFNADVESYIYNVNNILCFYRKDLKEDRCIGKSVIIDSKKAVKK